MNFCDETRRTVADMPGIHAKFTFYSVALGLVRAVLLFTLYVAALKEVFSIWELQPLVLAFLGSGLFLFPVIIHEVVSEHEYPDAISVVAIAVGAVVFVGFAVVNDPLWVKRAISFIAAAEILFLVVSLGFFNRLAASRSNFDAKLFLKGQAFQGPKAFVVLLVNEAAIWTNSDLLWIASRALLVILVPLVYVMIAGLFHR